MVLIYGLSIYRDGYEGVAWDSHELKVIHVNKLEVTPTNLPWVQVQWVKKSVFYCCGHLAAIFFVPSKVSEDVTGHIKVLTTFTQQALKESESEIC